MSADPPPAGRQEEPGRRRPELAVVLLLLGATPAAAAFIVLYVAFPDTQLLGLALGLALALLGVAAAVAGKVLVPGEKAQEDYHDFGEEEPQAEVPEIVARGGEGLSRRRLMAGAAGAAGLTLGAAALIPVASLGPSVGERIYRTPWRAGRRVVTSGDEPILADEVPEGTFLTGFPEGADKAELGSPLLVLRFPPEELELAPERMRGAPEGILAFSKICPHAGCAVSTYRKPLYPPTEPRAALVCPCHYSTFDPRRGGEVLFGPAGRDLPQLPLRVNGARELVAGGDFLDPIGPTYGGTRLRGEGT